MNRMRHARASLVVLALLALGACGGQAASGQGDGGTVDGSALDGQPDSTDLDAGSDGADATSATDATDATGIGDAAAEGEAAPPYTGPTVMFSGEAVESPSATPLGGVTVCVYAEPGIPCVMASPTGQFSVPVPANSNTAVTLSLPGYDSVLVATVTDGQDQSGWEIGMAAASDMGVIFSALGTAYPNSAAGFLGAYVNDSSSGTFEGLAGVTTSFAPQSGSGPIYITNNGAPSTSLTATSSWGESFFGTITPGEVTVLWAPASASSTLTCTPNFGGWPSSLPNAVRAPIAAGFDTHLGMACTLSTVDAGTPTDASSE